MIRSNGLEDGYRLATTRSALFRELCLIWKLSRIQVFLLSFLIILIICLTGLSSSLTGVFYFLGIHYGYFVNFLILLFVVFQFHTSNIINLVVRFLGCTLCRSIFDWRFKWLVLYFLKGSNLNLFLPLIFAKQRSLVIHTSDIFNLVVRFLGCTHRKST